MGGAHELVEVPAVGRVFHGHQRTRLGDIAPTGRLRLDAVVRYLQDVANDDAHDSGIDNPAEWVVRRTVIEVHRSAQLREDLDLVTFCSGVGPCWAERRTRITGSAGAHLEAAALWVQIDASTGRPVRLDAAFSAVYGPSTAGRTVKAKLLLTDPVPGDAARRAFPLRAADLDVLGHVNNAVYWSMVEELVEPPAVDPANPADPADPADVGGAWWIELEHHQPLTGADHVVLRRSGDRLWVCVGDAVAAAARWGTRPVA